MKVSLLVLDGAFDTGLSVLLDTLTTANELNQAAGKPAPYQVEVCGLTRSVTTHHGLRVPVARADPDERPDVAITVALGAKTPESVARALDRRDVGDAALLLRAWSKAGARVGGACTGTFVLAMAGLLDGGEATTTWWLAPMFRERHPQVILDESRMIVPSRRVVTAGAAMAHVDLALWLVRQRSPSLAQTTANHLVFDARPSQAAFVMPHHLEHADPVVERFETWARKHLDDFSLARAARQVGVSERTLERRIRAVLGKTPVSYLQDLRVEMAIHRLRTTKDSVEQIAAAVGYGDGGTLRTLLRKKTGRGMRELRRA